MSGTDLVVFETHPIQYHAPIYRLLQQRLGIPVTVVYGSDFSVVAYRDSGFGVTFAWDTDLLSGYSSEFLSRVSQGGATSVEKVGPSGLGRIFSRVKPRAVLVVGYSPFFHQSVFLQAWMAGIPILLRCEAKDRLGRSGRVHRWVRDCGLRWMYRRCSRVLYIGRRAYEHFQRLKMDESKLIFSPYCVDTTPFQCSEADRSLLRLHTREELGLREDSIVILFSGKLVHYKRPELILRAVKQLPASIRVRTTVLFLGSGELQPVLERVAQSELALQVRFLGFQGQLRLSRYYHAADMLVLPSGWETWGLVVNEALHHGLPVVVSEAVGCAPDLVIAGETGEVFRTDSISDLATAIQRAMALVGRQEIRDACRQRVSRYTVEKAAEGIALAYGQVCHE